MVDIGLSTDEALRAGTTTAAALMGLDSIEAVAGVGAGGVPSGAVGGAGGGPGAAGGLTLVGRVAPGYAADLVLFDGDLSRVGLSEARRRVSQVYRGGVRKR